MTVSEFVAYLAARGTSLTMVGDKLRIRSPRRALTPQVLAALQKHKSEFVAYLARWRGKPIPKLLACLADHGVWIELDETGRPRFQGHEAGDLDGADEAVIHELHGRADELIAFLRKRVGQMTVEELDALGYRKTLPDEVIDKIFADWPVERDAS